MNQQRRTWHRTAAALVALLLTLAASRVAAADTITLMWDPSQDSSVTGYIVYVGTQPGTYTQNMNVGSATSYSFTSAVAGQQYCFAVSAYAAGPVEGPKSAEVCGYSDQRPTLTNPGAQSSTAGQSDTLQLVGSDPDGLAVTYSATGLPPGLSIGTTTGFISGTPTTTGNYSVTATVSDGVLTASQTFSWNVAAGDATAPAVTITSPTSASTYTTSTTPLTVGGTASDAVGVTQVTWANSRGGSGTATGTTAWSAGGITLLGGSNIITITARDAAGNTSSDTLTVTYNAPDTTAPAVTVTVPTTSATYTTGTTPMTVGGTASDAVGVTQVTWANSRGGSGTAIGTTSWSASGITLLGGSNIITITARDAAGNTATDTLTVTYNAPDTTNPAVAITGPTSSATHATSVTPMTLSGTASDNVGVTQVIWSNDRGGSGTASGTASWSATGVVLQSGANVITVTARDAAGNTAADTLTVTYTPPDTTSPGVAINTPTSASTYTSGGATMSLGGTASDNVGVTQVTWANNRGGNGTATGTTSWSVASITLQDGSNTLTVTARDAAGNTATDILTVTYNAPDTTAPVVTITQPTSSSTFSTTGTTASVSGTASDAVGVTQVTWANDRGGNGTATGTTSWSVSGITLQNGSNVITINARDAAGNTATDTLTISSTQPLTLSSLTANQTSPQLVGTPVTFTAVAANGTAPYSYKWWVFDGANWTVLQNWTSGSNAYTWTPVVANSAYRVAVWVRSAGNTADTYDNAQSNGSLAFPVNPATAPLAVTSLAANRTAPQPVNTAVTFTAAASGGTAPYWYKWLATDGVTTAVLQNWSTNDTMTWTPSTPNANYQIIVWARSASSTMDAAENANATRTMAFPITAAASSPLTLTGLTANMPAPQPVGTPITFNATVSGGTAPHQFKWWVFDGKSWIAMQNWSTSNSWTWTPTSAGGNQRVAVWVRNAGSTADAYDNPASNGSIAYGITGGQSQTSPLAITSLTANRTSPQPVGTPITFAATISGGTAPQQFKWMLSDGSTTSVAQAWSTNNTWTWTPATANANYQITVWARSATSTTDAAENANSTRSLPFAIGSVSQGPLTLTGLTANLAEPQVVGTPITFTATVSGGVAPHQFKWWVYDGSVWTVTQNWTNSNRWTWTPAAASNKWRIAVWVRNAGSTADAYDNPAANGSIGFQIKNSGQQAPQAPLTVTSLTANRTAPQPVGTTVTFTAAASGGATPYQYKWWVFDGTDWIVVQSWSASDTFTWTPTIANSGYRVSVWVRNAGSTEDAYDNDANASISFPISSSALGSPVLLTGINTSLTSPQPAGTSITFTALATGGTGNYQYKWWIFDGVSWFVARTWDSTNAFTWTPGAANANYRVAVWIRNSGSTTDAYDNPSANGSIPFVIQ
jgi:hypothetical protein